MGGEQHDAVAGEAKGAMVATLRQEIQERTKAQLQIVVIAGVVAAGLASFERSDLTSNPELLAIAGVLFVGFALGALRQDEAIAFIASHLLERTYGQHALAQASWEAARHGSKGASGRQQAFYAVGSLGTYVLPVAAAIYAIAASIAAGVTSESGAVLAVAGLLGARFVLGIVHVSRAYSRLGVRAKMMLGSPN